MSLTPKWNRIMLFVPESMVQKVLVILVAFSLLQIGWVIYQRLFSPLYRIPGPFWASVTRLWYVQRISAGDMHKYTKALHEKYGPVVRIAPNEISCSDPAAMRTIYAVKSEYTKTDWYLPLAVNLSPHGDSFTESDIKRHSKRRKLINNIFTMSSILESEKYIDSVSRTFSRKMSEFADSKATCDIGEWVHFYASDVICELFFGHSFGFVEQGKDVSGFNGALDKILPPTVMMAVLPAWVRPFQVLLIPVSSSFRLAISRFTTTRAAAIHLVDQRVGAKSERKDMLEKLLEISKAKSPEFDITDVYTESYSALFAGSDTVAIAMRSVIYHVCRNPAVYKKLVTEIDLHHAAGNLSEYISYREARKLDYTIATIKEAMRVHPSAALTFPRHVPKGGATLSGHFIPEGYRVGVNPYVLHHNTEIFGPDANYFNPDRWFRPDADAMERNMFQFGKGARTCLGLNVAIAELYKFVPQFLREFEIELVTDKEWDTKNFWFVKQTGLECRVKERTVI